jgi:hypothetical protein
LIASRDFPGFQAKILREDAEEREGIRPVRNADGTVRPIRVHVPDVNNDPEARERLTKLVKEGYHVLQDYGVNPDQYPGKTQETRWILWALSWTKLPPVGEWPNAPVNESELTNLTECWSSGLNAFHLSYLALGELMARYGLYSIDSTPIDRRVRRALVLLEKQCREGSKPNVSKCAREAGINVNTLRSNPLFKQVYAGLTWRDRVPTEADVEADAELTPLEEGRLTQKTHEKSDPGTRVRKRSSS